MYLIIAYHGIGKNEMENDLRILWDNVSRFASSRDIRHIYCFQAVKDKEGADTLIVVQCEDNVAAKLALLNDAEQSLQTRCHVDYWLYIRR